MNFRLPSSIQIGPAHYTFTYEDPKDYLSLVGLCAEVSHMQRSVRVDKTQAAERVFESVIHEVVHIICDIYELPNEEKDVSRMAYGLAQFLQQLESEPESEEVVDENSNRPRRNRHHSHD